MSASPLAAVSEVERLRAQFERLARVECGERSPLYAEICRSIAGDDATLALALCAPKQQRRPTLLLAAIHDLLLAGVEHELAAHVPTVAGGATRVAGGCAPPFAAPGAGGGTPLGARAVAGGRAGALALAFCREHRAALAHTLATRATQTNEVNRAAALLPALVSATPPGAPLRLVELGASAGLNLLVDRFEFRYGAGGVRGSRAPRGRTADAGAVACDCAVDGVLPRLAMPRIAERIGVDLAPVDVRDDRDARWLLACIWPDEADRVARLRAAIALARRDPPRVLRGDALALLPGLVDGASGAHPVIWHSWVLAYATPAQQHALAVTIDELGARRDLTWLYLEQPRETPGLPTPFVAGARHDPEASALVAVRYRAATRTACRLADAHPHVHSMRWLTAAA